MIKYKKYSPSGSLKEYVKYYYAIEHSGSAEQSSLQRITPDGCVEINFNLTNRSLLRIDGNGKSTIQPECYIVNRASKHYFVKRTQSVKIVGVCFYPWGFHSFSKIPLSELKDMQLPLEDVFGAESKELYEQMSEMSTGAAMVNALDAFLCKRYLSASVDNMVIETAKEMYKSPFQGSVSSLAELLTLSTRRVEQRYKEVLGSSPKQFMLLARFQKNIQQLKKHSLFDLTFNNGYYDQPHFIHEFKRFSGVSPKQYISQNNSLNDLVTEWGK